MGPRGRELVENEEQYKNKKMKSIVVEEQLQEEGSETGFVDLDEDTLRNVFKRVDKVTLGRAACVNKLWKKVAGDDCFWVILGEDLLRNVLQRVDMVTLGRALCVNKLWLKVAQDLGLWEPLIISSLINRGKLEQIDEIRTVFSRRPGTRHNGANRRWVLSRLAKPPPSDFYSIDPLVFSSQIKPWV